MRTLTKRGRTALLSTLALTLTLGFQILAPGTGQAQTSLQVNLAADVGPSEGVGLGFLYGVTGDGTQPSDALLEPLRMNAFRAGGHMTRGWIEDGYQYGDATRTILDSITDQAERFTAAPYEAQYQAILSDMYGAYGGQGAGTLYPCDNGDCSNWRTFVRTVVAELRDTGLPIAYDIWNEPDISIFWERPVNGTQYFQMWDSAVQEIRATDPDALIVGPSFAYTPDRRPDQWNTWLQHTRDAGTLPDWIANHTLGNIDDPVEVGDDTLAALAANGIPPLPLSANEYQPQNMQTANVTAWYLARFAQSDYDNAMRGNWICCLTPNLTGLLVQSGGTWQPTGNYWVMRAYADMTGTLVQTSGQVGGTAISAAKDAENERAVAVIGNINGYTGSANVDVTGLSSVPWLTGGGSVHVTVQRIPEQAPLGSPQVVYSQDVSASGGSVSVPLNFQNSGDAFAVYLTPADGTGTDAGQVRGVASGRCLDVPDSTTTAGTQVQIWDCNAASNQEWTYTGGQLSVYSGGTRRCLDAYENQTTPGTQAIIWPCHGGSNQQWTLGGDGTVRSVQSGLCLDVSGAATANGSKAILWTCHGGSNQRWTVG
ncbi:hypothetical protein E9998_08795 [Glycomyces paridis]|uniref:Ricin B lectin domain-containing protein n=2 Tax=Glycomyces paridis TaxID=2126555 RepID=A0A4S8PJM1_9ACTN|nr:hypothetical protein E9998_08795 [Glycomyces paridis]